VTIVIEISTGLQKFTKKHSKLRRPANKHTCMCD